ncbi:uncharacterized protein LOC126983058 isoform X1 [Eriocheir sinensis]|uniref:uncharacterized protein LOC126983058 isoform X1 n=1 Tax=Eriocheir sinensis TaxID=95602 RepID=UPI0021C58F7F|nr:uncharacterized protein LOC126983058 isoform X1 [Eriocheir sinensis]XP_050691486.1 uncharacterized protein LOC126983058 isoform X1 [Eriocheir sinensis]XP_050691487.1 uncharacterized protein LOC126983058 isoform X1 [Eriocheir sinensis]XP_050691488.1 uncharacterized protein LOC126983058 isoform X1 [Eriocheir sinensis]XP_050691489.1 uncharacterized protein LOC126983058 isoform X1 [Eriocheir sinensis]
MEAVNNGVEDSWRDAEGEIPHPVVVVLGADGDEYWCNTPPPEVNITMWGTPSGPSSGSCTPNTRSPSLNSFCSEASWSDAGSDDSSVFKSNGDRSRHASTEVLSDSHGFLKAAPERLCASQDHLNTGKAKERHLPRSRQYKTKEIVRERSASIVEENRRDASSDSKVKKFISRMRSHSHHELLLHGRSRAGSLVDAEKLEESLDPEPREVPPAAINSRLLGRFRKHGLDLKKRRWSAWDEKVHIFRMRGHRNHEEDDSDPPRPAALAPAAPAPRKAAAVLNKPHLTRTRSNSESDIIVNKKKRKRRFLAKDSRVRDLLMEFHYRKKRGSLPSLDAEEQRQQQKQGEVPRKEGLSVRRDGRALSFHNLTDFAVDDYFGGDTPGTLSEDETDGDRSRPALLELDAHPHPHGRDRRPRFSIDNILNVIRGRRLSHDVGAAGRHVTEAVVPWLRGKSRSVDHSIHNPFDLDVLRKKIGERTASEPSRDTRSPSPGR